MSTATTARRNSPRPSPVTALTATTGSEAASPERGEEDAALWASCRSGTNACFPDATISTLDDTKVVIGLPGLVGSGLVLCVTNLACTWLGGRISSLE